MIRVVHPGFRSGFYTHPGSRCHKDAGFRIRIRSTAKLLSCCVFQNPHQINGRKVDVKKALPKEETRGGAGIIC
jgi:hypothetical protein